MGSITGVRVPDNTQRSTSVLKWQNKKGQTEWFQPYIVSGISVNLWGWMFWRVYKHILLLAGIAVNNSDGVSNWSRFREK